MATIAERGLTQLKARSSVTKNRSLTADLAAGAACGLVATIPMTALMLAGHRRLPRRERYSLPPRQITMRVADAIHAKPHLNERAKRVATYLAHFGYGATMGAAYGGAARRRSSTTGGTLFGLLVWTGSYLGLLPALRILPPATRLPWRRNVLMIGAHLVWGAALGGLDRIRKETLETHRAAF